jgi:hypothetical protein
MFNLTKFICLPFRQWGQSIGSEMYVCLIIVADTKVNDKAMNYCVNKKRAKILLLTLEGLY